MILSENMGPEEDTLKNSRQDFITNQNGSSVRDEAAVPEKLKNDAIVEAIFEIRFSMSTLPEVLFGRLMDSGSWKNFSQAHLPIYQIPAPMRQADPNLRYQPVFSLADSDAQRALRIGPQVISYSRGIPYVGWQKFKSELSEVIGALFQLTKDLRIERLGLRYLNALRRDLHGIDSLSDLDIGIRIADQVIDDSVNLNATFDRNSETCCTVRVATADIIQGNLPPGTSVYVDVDVSTHEGFETHEQSTVEAWIERAHRTEKLYFFRLLTKETIENLRER